MAHRQTRDDQQSRLGTDNTPPGGFGAEETRLAGDAEAINIDVGAPGSPSVDGPNREIAASSDEAALEELEQPEVEAPDPLAEAASRLGSLRDPGLKPKAGA